MVDMSFRLNYIRARGYRLSPEELRVNRIVGVYNSVGIGLDAGYIEQYASSVCYVGRGEVMIVEVNKEDVNGVLLDVVSVIVFKDLLSLHTFAMRHGMVYFGDRNMGKGFPALLN